ncbi:MAG: ketoacyl-ACP synthase III family protein, partial [Archangium sp.]
PALNRASAAALNEAYAHQAPLEPYLKRLRRLALERAGLGPEEISVVLHASSWYQGLEFWPAASYVHHQVVGSGNSALAMDVQQMSNGGLAAMDLAASYLAAEGARQAALVTVADRFCEPGFDRWRSDSTLYGDGAAALVLSRRGGFARLRNVVSLSDTFLEVLFRGREPFGPVSGHAGRPVDIRKRREAVFELEGRPVIREHIAKGLNAAIARVLDEAGIGIADLARIVLPNVGLSSMRFYTKVLGIELSKTQWEWGRNVGHLGAADQFAGLTHLVESGEVGPGDRVLLVGIGAGFVWSCAVVELLDRPAWAASRG